MALLHQEINPHKTATVRDLGVVDLGRVRADTLALPDAEWDRSDDFEANYNKHGAIRAVAHVIFRFSDRRQTPLRCYDLPVWERWQTRLLPIMEAAVRPFGYARGFYPRIMLARLPAQGFVPPHVDGHVSVAHKIHVPIVTNPDTYFFVEGTRYHFPEGSAYEVNNSVRHAVVNGGATDRIHLIFEYLDADLQPFTEG